jgi:hypothetical protein
MPLGMEGGGGEGRLEYARYACKKKGEDDFDCLGQN